MRPAGMSSDEEDDDYFSMELVSKKFDSDKKQGNILENLPKNHSYEMRNLLNNSCKISLFHNAAEEGDFDKMEELIRNGVSVDDSKLGEWTPLMKACSMGDHRVVNFLLEKGANPNLHKELFTPLMACCTSSYVQEESRLECVRYLIRFGARVNATDKYKTTPLMMAAGAGLNEIVQELLNAPEIDVNVTDRSGWNALFHAVNWNNKAAVEKLIRTGIDPNQLNLHEEYGAVELAEMKSHKEIEKILREWRGQVISEESKPGSDSASVEIVKKCLIDFRNQFPDGSGIGGFSSDVRDFFAGVGLRKLYEKLKIDISLPKFLATENLCYLGVKFGPIRRRIMRGIHRYHTAPWHENSLHPVRDRIDLDMEDYIRALSNVTKHLAIMYSTLDYVRSRIPLWEGRTYSSFDKDIMDSLINSYVETNKSKRILDNISKLTDKIKSAGDVEADHVGVRRKSAEAWRGFWFNTGVVCLILGYLYRKFRYS